MIVPLISANIEHNPQESHWSILPFMIISQGIQRSYYKLSSGVRGTTQTYLNLIGTKKENKFLIKKNEELKAQLGALSELKLENQRLNKLLSFKKNTNMDLLGAKVIASSVLPDQSALVIDKGYKHGIEKNMAAITPGGIVGYVVESLPKTAKILLITDRYFVADVIVQRTRARGLLEGHSKNFSRINQIDQDSEIKINDNIVTSGLYNVFPKGFPVGKIVEIKKGAQNSIDHLLIKPAINPYITEELFIILATNNADLEPVESTEEEALKTIQEKYIQLKNQDSGDNNEITD